MTNKEAITRINMMLKLNRPKYADDIEALNMAIKALKKDEKNYNDAFIDGIKQGIDALNEVLNHQNAGRRLTMPNKRDY